METIMNLLSQGNLFIEDEQLWNSRQNRYIYHRYLMLVNTEDIFNPPKRCYVENNLRFSSIFIIPMNCCRKPCSFPKGLPSGFENLRARMQVNHQLLDINHFSCWIMHVLGRRALPKMQCCQFWMQFCFTYWVYKGNQTQK